MIADLPAEALDAFIGVAGASASFPLLSVEMRHLEGELGRPRSGYGALASIDARYAMYAVGMTPVPELKGPVAALVEAIKDALLPWTARHMYLNFADTARDPATFWNEQAYRRLRRIRAAVDPDDRFRSNHPVPPAGADRSCKHTARVESGVEVVAPVHVENTRPPASSLLRSRPSSVAETGH
jgi:hypothetical protein